MHRFGSLAHRNESGVFSRAPAASSFGSRLPLFTTYIRPTFGKSNEVSDRANTLVHRTSKRSLLEKLEGE